MSRGENTAQPLGETRGGKYHKIFSKKWRRFNKTVFERYHNFLRTGKRGRLEAKTENRFASF